MTPALATVVLDPFTALIVGCALGLFSAPLIRRTPQSELFTTALFGAAWGLWYGLCVGWFYFRQPDWMFVYLLDTGNVPLLPTYLVFVVLLTLFGAMGALSVGALAQHGRAKWGIALLGASVVAELLLMALQQDAYNHFGTFRQYHDGVAKPLEAHPDIQQMLAISGIASALPAIAMLAARVLKGRKLPAAA